MKLRASSIKSEDIFPDCISDPEEKEFSDEDDDDRNHKHRRRETLSQPLEGDSTGSVLSRSYRYCNKPFENGYPFKGSDSQSSENWKNYNDAPLEKDLPSKFDKRRLGLSAFPRLPPDLNQKFRVNQSITGDSGPGRGRGRDIWNQCNPVFGSVDSTSQIVRPGSMPPIMFAGRGLPAVSNTNKTSWGAFGLIPRIPNGGLSTLHPLGLQGTLGPPLNPTLNMGIHRQRCRDFEEQGFCLRGDMCPMEHGVNRIVVEDVQSLSQFNLPVSLPNAHLVGVPTGTVSLPSITASSSTLTSGKIFLNRSSKLGVSDDGMILNSAYSSSDGTDGADFYDPDQPLWNHDCPKSSTPLLGLPLPKVDEPDSLLDGIPADSLHLRFSNSIDTQCASNTTGIAVGSQNASSSVWGRVGSVKSKSEPRKLNPSFSDQLGNDITDDHEALANAHGTNRGKQIIVEDADPNRDQTPKMQKEIRHRSQKPSQKAQRTLFVNGIPQKNNRREALLSHFQKFGDVIDIYIPSNSGRAFIQFSTREEAEAALKAPDAVMGNRFIKLWWANRDSILNDGAGTGNSVPVIPSGIQAASVAPHVNRGTDNLQAVAPQVKITNASDAPTPYCDHSKAVTNNVKQKMELLKEVRKKQEMLDQMRNEFRRRLDNFEKQAVGPKGETAAEQASKRQKVRIACDIAKAAISQSTDTVISLASPRGQIAEEKNGLAVNATSCGPKLQSVMALHEASSLKRSIQQLAPRGSFFPMNKHPISFRIAAPLPLGLASVGALKEHFMPYGVSCVELEDPETHDGSNSLEASKSCTACITFTDGGAAERAFINGKCWQGHSMQFVWLKPAELSNKHGGNETCSPALKGPNDAHLLRAEDLTHTETEEEATVSKNGEPGYSEGRKAENEESGNSDNKRGTVENFGPDKVIRLAGDDS